MLDRDPYDGEPPSSISGISEPANLAGGSADVNGLPSKTASSPMSRLNRREAKRQSYLRHDKKPNGADLWNMVISMGRDKLYKPFLTAQLEDLRSGNKPDGHYSATLIWTIIAGAKALPYASEAAMDLLAANSDREPAPVAPHLEIDTAA